MIRKTRRNATISLALVAASVLLLPGAGDAASRPIPLDRLGEKERIRLIESATPTDAFTLRGRRISAKSLQESLANGRRKAEADRLRGADSARAFRTDNLELLRLRAELAEKAAAEKQKEAIDRLVAELRRNLPPDSPEVRRLSEEASRLAAAWVFAGPEERRTLEERIRALAEELRRLGVAL